jgi:hypothetical protein
MIEQLMFQYVDLLRKEVQAMKKYKFVEPAIRAIKDVSMTA